MRLFIDTNLFVEYFSKRCQFLYVRQIFNAIEDKRHEGFISSGSFYTIAYVMEMEMKRNGVKNPEKLKKNRDYLCAVLDLVSIVSANGLGYRNGVMDENFSDLEDSFQYQCAIASNCDVLLTINTPDFKGADKNRIMVMSPEDFVKQYLE